MATLMIAFLVLFVISILMLVFGIGGLITAAEEGDLNSLHFGVFFFVVGIISMIACCCLFFNVIGDSTTDIPSTEEHVALSEDSTPATSEKLYQVVSIYDVNGNLIEQYVDEYE